MFVCVRVRKNRFSSFRSIKIQEAGQAPYACPRVPQTPDWRHCPQREGPCKPRGSHPRVAQGDSDRRHSPTRAADRPHVTRAAWSVVCGDKKKSQLVKCVCVCVCVCDMLKQNKLNQKRLMIQERHSHRVREMCAAAVYCNLVFSTITEQEQKVG